ncbi:MAG: DNA polymerase III subunit gamma/tau [Planctomycetota bacterium]
MPQQEGYVALARRYRPQTFDEVVGQNGVAQTLRNAIALNRLSHAYLFTGPRGCGKTTLARIFAKSLNCRASDTPTPTPCGKCVSCLAIAAGEDLDVLEMDGASHNSVDDVRALRESLAQATTGSRFKIIYIDEVHMLSTAAFNALLKSLEEPPAHVKFIFATTDPQKLPATIIARCQRYEIKLIGPADMAAVLERLCAAEKIECETGAIPAIVRAAKGGLRDAENLLDQAICYGAGKLTRAAVEDLSGAISDLTLSEIIDGAQAQDLGKALGAVARSLSGGAQPGDLLNGLIEYVHAIMMWKTLGPDHPDLVVWKHHGRALEAQALRWTPAYTLTALQILQQVEKELRFSPYPRMALDAAVAQLSQLPDLLDLAAVLREPAGFANSPPPQAGPNTLAGGGPPGGMRSAPPANFAGRDPQRGPGTAGNPGGTGGPGGFGSAGGPGGSSGPNAGGGPNPNTRPRSYSTAAPAATAAAAPTAAAPGGTRPTPAAAPHPTAPASARPAPAGGSGASGVEGSIAAGYTRESVLAALGVEFKPNLRNILIHANGLFVKSADDRHELVVLLGHGSPQKSRALEAGAEDLLARLAETLGGQWTLTLRGGVEGASISGRHQVLRPQSSGPLPATAGNDSAAHEQSGPGGGAPNGPPPLSPAVENALDLFGGEIVDHRPPPQKDAGDGDGR